MTVIFGVNLSDRIYIAGDSRLSALNTDSRGNEQILFKHDDMLKVEPIIRGKGSVIASAGDARFARFVLKRLYQQQFVQQGAKSIREHIQAWVGPIVNEYFCQFGNSSVTFLIGGADDTAQKKLIGMDIKNFIQEYLGHQDGSGSIKKVIVDGIQAKGLGVPNPEPVLPIANTLLFSIEITPREINICDTKWGEYLIYGPRGLNHGDVNRQNIASLEFSNDAGEVAQDTMIINAIIHDLATSKDLATVGGCVVVMMAFSDNTVYFVDGDIYAYNHDDGVTRSLNKFRIVDGRYFRLDERNTMHRLHKVSEYTGKGKHDRKMYKRRQKIGLFL